MLTFSAALTQFDGLIIKLSCNIAIVELQGILYCVVCDLLEFKDKRTAQILLYQTLSWIVDLVKLMLLEYMDRIVSLLCCNL